MKCVWCLTLLGGLLLAGCGQETGSAIPDPKSMGPGPGVPPKGEPSGVASAKSGQIELSPENAKIEFVGTHAGKKPDPRTGGFAKFTGKAELEADGKTLKAIWVDIDTTSLWTEFNKLTTHLNSPDFFDTRQHPTAKFVSTKIDADGKITGNLTLLGNTKEISFPATVKVDDQGLTLTASFTIDRTQFGMDKLQGQVEKPVTLSVAIGEKTQPKKAS